MDLTLNDEDRRFQKRLRTYLADVDRPSGMSGPERLAWHREFAAQLFDEGLAMPAWPRRWGGMELPLTQQIVYHQEFAQAHLSPHPSPTVGMVGPTLLRHGTAAQRERFLEPMARAVELWCQGFSEPNAGSDLPALSTRAERLGDTYVVTGQKVWTSRAHTADWMFALVRTGSQEVRDKGISYLLIDMASPGIEVRPLKDMAEGQHFSEVFLDEVEVPVENRVGDEHEGWPIARTTLGHERSAAFVATAMRYRRVVDELLQLARDRGADRDASVRQQLADIETKVRVIHLNTLRVLSNVIEHGEPGAASSISRLFFGAFEQRLHELAMRILGPDALLAPRDPHSVQRGRWVWGFLNTRAATIGAGTAEIQRNTIAERMLGLPRSGSRRP